MALTVALRPAEPGDDEFLCQVYRSTREPELAQVNWDEAQKAAFVRMQYEAQSEHYRKHYVNTSYDVVVVDGVPAGRLWVSRMPTEIRVMDITLLPAFRGRGVGTSLLTGLIEEAAGGEQSLTIHLEVHNPARRLYNRLGFVPIAEHGLYTLMERRPTVRQANTAS